MAIKSGTEKAARDTEIYDFDLSRVKLNHHHDRFRAYLHRSSRSASVWDWRRCHVSLRLRQCRVLRLHDSTYVYIYIHIYIRIRVVRIGGEPRALAASSIWSTICRGAFCRPNGKRYPSARHEEATWDRLIKSFRVASKVVGFISQRCSVRSRPYSGYHSFLSSLPPRIFFLFVWTRYWKLGSGSRKNKGTTIFEW